MLKPKRKSNPVETDGAAADGAEREQATQDVKIVTTFKRKVAPPALDSDETDETENAPNLLTVAAEPEESGEDAGAWEAWDDGDDEPDLLAEAAREFSHDADLNMRVYLLPNYDSDGRADSRAKKVFKGPLSFRGADYYEGDIQARFGGGAYLIELRHKGRILRKKVVEVADVRPAAPVVDPQTGQPIVIQQPAAPAVDVAKIMAQAEDRAIAQMERYAKLMGMAGKGQQPASDPIEQLERLERLKQMLAPAKAQEDEVTATLKARVAEKMLDVLDGDADGPALSNDAPWYAGLLLTVAPALPTLLAAATNFFQGAAPQPAPQPQPLPQAVNPAPVTQPQPAPQPQKKQVTPVQYLLSLLIQGARENAPDYQNYVTAIVDFMNNNPEHAETVSGFLSLQPSMLLTLLKTAAPKVALPDNAEQWLTGLQQACFEAFSEGEEDGEEDGQE